MNLGLQGTRALVCGASRGLGAAIAYTLHGEGAELAVAARESEDLSSVARDCGGTPLAVDLTTAEGSEEAVTGAASALGGLDLLVVNSGGPPPGGFAEVDPAAWKLAIDGTLLAAIRLIRNAVPHLQESDRAAIVIVLASSVRLPVSRLVTSNVTRPALVGLIKTLALELAPRIRINGAAPGKIATARSRSLDQRVAERRQVDVATIRGENEAAVPLGRYGEPAEFGRAVTFLLSPAASYISGQVVPVDGAMTRTYP